MVNGQSAVLLPDQGQRQQAQAQFNREMAMLRFTAASNCLGHLMAQEVARGIVESGKYGESEETAEVQVNIGRAVRASVAAADALMAACFGVKVG